jgi:hypothetical protein
MSRAYPKGRYSQAKKNDPALSLVNNLAGEDPSNPMAYHLTSEQKNRI